MPAPVEPTTPAGKTRRRPAFRPALEALEDRTALSASLPDVSMQFATTRDSHSVTFQYSLSGATSPFQVNVYRSADGRLDAADRRVGAVAVTSLVRDDAGGNATQAGLHRVTAGGIDLPQDPTRPYVLVVADPVGLLPESREDNNAASFRKHLVGVVTHGFSLTAGVPPWATAMARALDVNQGYDAAFAFDWSALSKLPLPGMSTLAARRLAGQIDATARGLPRGPGDVVDLHVIGHSRGTVVNSLAVEYVAQAASLRGGWVRETMLDPHPARNLLPLGVAAADLVAGGNNISEGAFFAFRPGPLGVGPMLGILAAQQAMNDPVPYFASSVDQGEVFWQNTPAVQEPFDPLNMDSYANSWGYRPGMIPNLSGTAIRSQRLDGLFHFQVPLWYLNNLTLLVAPAGATRPAAA